MIIITGDSWAAGEFCYDSYNVPLNKQIVHRGLAQFLIDDAYQVLNLGSPGSGNLIAASKLRHFLMTNPDIKIDKIFVFQTDWERDIYSFTDFGMSEKLMQNKEPVQLAPWPGIYKLPPIEHANLYRDILLSIFYKCLSELSQLFDVKIYLIGGLSDLLAYDQFETEYPGVIAVCKSLVNLAIHNNPDPTELTTGYLTWPSKSPLVAFLKKHLPLDQQQEFLHQLDLSIQRYKLFSDRKDLFPDKQHGGRLVHQALYNLLKSKNIV